MTSSLPADNQVLPFTFQSSAFRGRLVRLGAPLDEILHRHAYPKEVATLLAETMLLAAALASTVKVDGVFTLQAKSDGAVRLLITDVTSTGDIRAYAQFDEAKLAEGGPVLGKGHLAFTADQPDSDERYQGIVDLAGGSLVHAVQHYFRQSEQLPTGIAVAARADEDGHWRGSCLLLQAMPRDGGHDVQTDTSVEEDWHRAMMLMQTSTAEEFTDPALSSEDLLFRLFHDEGVQLFDAKPLRHACRCSEERVNAMLDGIPPEELKALAVNGKVSVTCEFCNRVYAREV